MGGIVGEDAEVHARCRDTGTYGCGLPAFMSYSSISKQIDSERYKETATSFRRYKISPFSTLVSWANGRRRSSRATVSRGYISVSAFGTSRAGVEDIHYSSLNLLDDGIDLYLDVYQYQSSMDCFTL